MVLVVCGLIVSVETTDSIKDVARFGWQADQQTANIIRTPTWGNREIKDMVKVLRVKK
jgi:hypothetical protein